MKIIISVALLILCNTSFSQPETSLPQNGIYKTDTDVVEHRVFLGFNKNDQHHFKLKIPLFHNVVNVKTPDTTYKFYFSGIWGYRENDKIYRLYSDQIYQLTHRGKICTYVFQNSARDGNDVRYFFSTTLAGPMYPETRSNLKAAYHSDTVQIKYLLEE